MLDDLPVLGIGASLSLSAEPDPVELARSPGGPAFIEYAGQADVRKVIGEIERVHSADIPVLFHPSYINFCGSFSNDPAWLEATLDHINRVRSPWFAQDLAYCFWQGGPGYSSQLGYFIPPILNESSLDKALVRLKEVQAIVQVPLAIEPPPMTFAVGHMPLLEFFGRLAEDADCGLLLDMGHLVSYEMASGNHIVDELDYLPRERVIELHIAGGKVKDPGSGPVYIDAHESGIQQQCWDMFVTMLPELPAVKAVCYECEGTGKQEVLETLEKIRGLVKTHSASTLLRKQVEASQ